MGCGASKEEPSLLASAGEGDVAACKNALHRGVSPNIRDEHGATPLHYAVEMGACVSALCCTLLHLFARVGMDGKGIAAYRTWQGCASSSALCLVESARN